MNSSVFSGRQKQLEQIFHAFLNITTERTNFLLVSGELGQGKTYMLTEFFHRVKSQFPNILIAAGECNAITGQNDGFLPFREIISSLAGIDGKGKDQSINTDLAVKTMEILVDIAPDIIGVFVPGAGLVAKLGTMIFPAKERLQKLILEQEKNLTGNVDYAFRQSQLFEQYFQLLLKLSENQPIIILIEDIQWADKPSLELLFYLTKKIAQKPIFLITTVRSTYQDDSADEIGKHLNTVLDEIRNHYVNVDIYLDKVSEDERKEFIYQFVNNNFTPNSFDEEFLEILFKRSEGNPLFISDLLSLLVETGYIESNSQGVWQLSKPIRLEVLPSRLAGVIQSRINKLTTELREILTVASIEGEEFTVQVICRIKKLEETRLLEHLDQELSKHYHLVNSKSIETLGPTLLFIYQFRHSLFHTHLYNSISPAQKVLLHRSVGECLEELYEGDRSTIAIQLALHFTEGLSYVKAAQYRIISAQLEKRKYSLSSAKEQALQGIRVANSISDSQGNLKRTFIYDLYKLLAETCYQMADYKEAIQHFQYLLELSAIPDQKAGIYKNIGDVYEKQGQYDKAGVFYDLGLELIPQNSSDILFARLKVAKAYIHNCHFEVDKGRAMALDVLDILTSKGSYPDIAKAYQVIGSSYFPSGNFQEVLAYSHKSLELAIQFGDEWGRAEAESGLGNVYNLLGEIDKGISFTQKSLLFFESLGKNYRLSWLYGMLGLILADKGELSQSRYNLEKALKIAIGTEDVNDEEHILTWLGSTLLKQGFVLDAIDSLNKALAIATQVHFSHTVGIYHVLANAYLVQGNISLSKECLEQGYRFLQQSGILRHSWAYMLGFGQLNLINGDVDAAIENFRAACENAEETNNYAAKIQTYLALADCYLFIDKVEYAEKNLAMGVALSNTGYDYYLGIAERIAGKTSAFKNDFDEAAKHYKNSLELFTKMNAKYQIALSKIALGKTLSSSDKLALDEEAKMILVEIGATTYE